MSRTSETKNKILKILESGDRHLTELSSNLLLKPSTVAQHLKDLEGMGAVSKFRDPHFRNIKYYRLSRQGGDRKAGAGSKLMLLSIAIAIAAALGILFIAYHGSQGSINRNDGTLSVLLADPPSVPNGTQGIMITVNSISVTTRNGTRTMAMNSTIDLMSMANRSETLTEMDLPSNTAVESVAIGMGSVRIIFDGKSYPLSMANEIVVHPENLTIQSNKSSGILIQMSAAVYQNASDKADFMLVPSVTSVTMENMS